MTAREEQQYVPLNSYSIAPHMQLPFVTLLALNWFLMFWRRSDMLIGRF